jgi:Rha family phage regulatory protein
MSEIQRACAPVLAVVDGVPTTTSNDVASFFTKLHKNVIQSIESLLSDLPENARLNFQPSEYTDPTGRTLPAYRLTRDGFTLLAMGFTGKKALAFKLAYIDAFNRMEAGLRGTQRRQVALDFAFEASKVAARTVADAFLNDEEPSPIRRYLLSMSWNYSTRAYDKACVQAINHDAHVMSLDELTLAIGGPDYLVESEKLIKLANACCQRLVKRLPLPKKAA